MTSRTNGSMKRPTELNHVKEEAPNWAIIFGGALLSTLSIRLCCRLKQVFDFKRAQKTHAPSKDNENSTPNKKRESCKLHSQLYCFIPDDDRCYRCLSGAKHTPMSPISKDCDDTLPLVKVASAESSNENGGVMWASVSDHLELPPKPFNHQNSLDSPCLSECGSDIYSKREVVQKLRHQLKRREDMIVEMQLQIKDLQNSLTFQMAHNTHMQAQLDSSNQELSNSEREIQRLRKTISDQFSSECSQWIRLPEAANGHANECLDGFKDLELHCVGVEKDRGKDWIEMLKREIRELKEVIEGKEFLIQNYKEEKKELCSKLKELQLRLVSQASLPNIL